MHLVHRKTCGPAAPRRSRGVIDLGEQFLQGSFLKPGRIPPPVRRIPTSLVRCDPMKDEKACGLLQMEYTVPPEVLYSSYWYRSGTIGTMREHLQEIARDAVSLLGSPHASTFSISGVTTARFSASPRPRPRSSGSILRTWPQGIGQEATIIRASSRPRSSSCGSRKGLFDIVTSIAMFYDLEDPVAFCRSVKTGSRARGRLDPRDVVHAAHAGDELLTTRSVMSTSSTTASQVVEFILQLAGLQVVDTLVERHQRREHPVPCDAHGQLRFRSPVFDRNMKDLRRQEFDFELDTDKPYRNFRAGSTCTARTSTASHEAIEARREDDPRLRCVHEGQHHPAVVWNRQEDRRSSPRSGTPTIRRRRRSEPRFRS